MARTENTDDLRDNEPSPASVPTIEYVYDSSGGVQGEVSGGGSAASGTVVIEGTGQPHTSVTINVNGSDRMVTGVDAGGHWKTRVHRGQYGQHHVTAVAAEGKTSAAFAID